MIMINEESIMSLETKYITDVKLLDTLDLLGLRPIESGTFIPLVLKRIKRKCKDNTSKNARYIKIQDIDILNNRDEMHLHIHILDNHDICSPIDPNNGITCIHNYMRIDSSTTAVEAAEFVGNKILEIVLQNYSVIEDF